MAGHPANRMVTIYTQAYNTRPYLEQCINSVLSQTYTDFEYILIDNGCTDGSSALLDAFAEKDSRIRLIRYQENQVPRPLRYEIVREYARGAYYATIDSDDWWEPDYLERLVGFLEKYGLDMAITGTVNYLEQTRRSQILRKLDMPVILTCEQFAQHYPRFWTFPSTYWGSIIKTDLFQAMEYTDIAAKKYPYGMDTMLMLRYIELCGRIGIDNSALYHYRIHPRGISYQYSPLRFDANIAYYEQIREFLELHHTFDPPKQEWLKRVHLTSMCATLGLLRDAQVTAEEKLAECARIVEHPLTALVLTNDCDEREPWFSVMWEIAFAILSNTSPYDAEAMRTVLWTLAPRCHTAVKPDNVRLFSQEAGLYDILQKDDWEQMICHLMELIIQKRYTKQYNLGQMLCDLIPPQTPLEGISDARFFREYADCCMLVLCENYSAALEQMTGLLLGRKKLYAAEIFLKLYLSLSALEEQIPAFVFGKFQLAWLYLRQDRQGECKAIADELTEMGVENEELAELHQALEAGT